MKIYLLEQDLNNGYDTYDSVVVIAENENEARKIVVLGFINPLIDKIQTVNQEARDIKEGILEEFSQKLK